MKEVALFMDVDKEALTRAMEDYFGADTKRIRHAHRVTAYAEELMAPEKGDPSVVLAAGLFHDIGIHKAQEKYGSTSGKYQEIEGPPIARKILSRLGYEAEITDEVCEIIAHHHSPGKVNTQNFRILYDADWLVNLGDECDVSDKDKLGRVIDKVFLTESGRRKAKQVYLEGLE